MFRDFGTSFVYRYKIGFSASPIIGAQTRNRDGRIVAEARIRPSDNIEPTFEAEEVH